MDLRAPIAFSLVLAAASGCVPSHVIGPLQHEQDERDKLLSRSRRAGASEDVLKAIAPPLTDEETKAIGGENDSCRSSYLWKKSLTWTGGAFIGVAAGLTIGAAYTTGSDNTTPKVLGVSAGSLAALGGILVLVGEIVQQGFSDRGCWVR